MKNIIKNVIKKTTTHEYKEPPTGTKYGDKGFMKFPFEIVETEEIWGSDCCRGYLLIVEPYTEQAIEIPYKSVKFFNTEQTEKVKKNLKTTRKPYYKLNKIYWDNHITATPLKKLKVNLLSFNIVYKVIIGTLAISTIIDILVK